MLNKDFSEANIVVIPTASKSNLEMGDKTWYINDLINIKKLGFKTIEIVDFYILPHLNNSYFSKMTAKNVRKTLKNLKEKIYVLDDNSAVEIIDSKIKVISEGDYFILNK